MKDLISRQAVLDLIADYDLSMGQVVRGIHALQSVTPPEEELEKIKAEAEELIEHCDSDYEFEEIYGIRLVVGILDRHIAELKGENNE